MISYIENDSFTTLQSHSQGNSTHILKVNKLPGHDVVLMNAIERGMYDINGDELEISKRSDIILTYDKFKEFVNNCLLLIEGIDNK